MTVWPRPIPLIGDRTAASQRRADPTGCRRARSLGRQHRGARRRGRPPGHGRRLGAEAGVDGLVALGEVGVGNTTVAAGVTLGAASVGAVVVLDGFAASLAAGLLLQVLRMRRETPRVDR